MWWQSGTPQPSWFLWLKCIIYELKDKICCLAGDSYIRSWIAPSNGMECRWLFIFPLLPPSSVFSPNNFIFQSCPLIFCDSVSDNFVSHVPLLYKIGKGYWNTKLIVGEFCSLLFPSSATHRVLLAVAKVIVMWCGGTEEHEEDKWAGSVYCISPVPPKDPCNGSILCSIWKFYFHMEIDPDYVGRKGRMTVHCRLCESSLLCWKERAGFGESCSFGPSSLPEEIITSSSLQKSCSVIAS